VQSEQGIIWLAIFWSTIKILYLNVLSLKVLII